MLGYRFYVSHHYGGMANFYYMPICLSIPTKYREINRFSKLFYCSKEK